MTHVVFLTEDSTSVGLFDGSSNDAEHIEQHYNSSGVLHHTGAIGNVE